MTLRERYGPWAIVTGGSEGVGRALAEQLAAAGFDLVLLARTAAVLEALAEQLRAAHPAVRVVTGPVDLSAVDAAAQVEAVVGDREVGLLVLNAGANTLHGTLLEQSPADVDRALHLSIQLPVRLVQRYAPAMARRGSGGVLVMGSLAGYLGQPGLAVYSAGKAWQRLLCESLWLELAPHGVDVLHLVLGLTRTPAMERAGIVFDAPGIVVSEPADVASFALANLGNGPVVVAPGHEEVAQARCGQDRGRLVTSSAKRLGLLLPQGGPAT